MVPWIKMNGPNDKHREYPGDELILNPRKTITHSILVNAPVELIWPWLIQMGAGRAGWYSYDRIDNGGIPSAEKIIAGLQQIGPGDIMPAIPKSKDSFIVREIYSERALIVVVPVQTAVEQPDSRLRMTGPLRASWALILESPDQRNTKLISRARITRDWLSPSVRDSGIAKTRIFIERVYRLLARLPWFMTAAIASAGHYFMESRMLHGIKRRAEGQIKNQQQREK